MSKTFKITADDSFKRIDYQKLIPMQGALKSLSVENFEKLKKSILTHGFFVPVFLWNNGKETKLCDGHQRLRVLTKMAEEGYTIPKIPYGIIPAKDEKEAKEKLLLIVSQFGQVDKQGLYEFMQGLDERQIVTDLNVPGVDAMKFMDEYYDSGEAKIADLPPVAGDLKSVGGNGVKMLQLFFNEEDHQMVLKMIGALQPVFGTENATDTIKKALEECVEKAAG